jgi:hypothetical protein
VTATQARTFASQSGLVAVNAELPASSRRHSLHRPHRRGEQLMKIKLMVLAISLASVSGVQPIRLSAQTAKNASTRS